MLGRSAPATPDVALSESSTPCAYLAFGETYSAEVTAARDRGWPVSRMAGGHLEMLVRPEAVAEEMLDLLARAS